MHGWSYTTAKRSVSDMSWIIVMPGRAMSTVRDTRPSGPTTTYWAWSIQSAQA